MMKELLEDLESELGQLRSESPQSGPARCEAAPIREQAPLRGIQSNPVSRDAKRLAT